MNNINQEDIADVDDLALDPDARKAVENSEDAFERWKREEFIEENLTGEGVYLGDGVYG